MSTYTTATSIQLYTDEGGEPIESRQTFARVRNQQTATFESTELTWRFADIDWTTATGRENRLTLRITSDQAPKSITITGTIPTLNRELYDDGINTTATNKTSAIMFSFDNIPTGTVTSEARIICDMEYPYKSSEVIFRVEGLSAAETINRTFA